MTPISAVEELQAGTVIEWQSGHHPGSQCEVLGIHPNYIQLLGTRGGKNTPALLHRRPFRVRIDTLLSRADVISHPKQKRAAHISTTQEQIDMFRPPEVQEVPEMQLHVVPEAEAPPAPTQNGWKPDGQRVTAEESLLGYLTFLEERGLTPDMLNMCIKTWGIEGTGVKLGWNRGRIQQVVEHLGLYRPGSGRHAPGPAIPADIVARFPFPDRTSKGHAHATKAKLSERPGPVTTRQAPIPDAAPVPYSPNGKLTGMLGLVQQMRETRAQMQAREQAIRAELSTLMTERMTLDKTIELMRVGVAPGEVKTALDQLVGEMS